MWTIILPMLCFWAFASAAFADPSSDSSEPSDDTIRGILADRIDNQRQTVGLVVGLIGPGGRRVITYGHPDNSDPRLLNGDSIFEIGAITKVFTALVLADMVQRHEVALKDPISRYLPKTLALPDRTQGITLQHLATHTSGLPRTPTNLLPRDPANPYVDYTTKQLYDFLMSYRLQREPGAESEYSNAGFGLLGTLLTARNGMSYDALVRARIAVGLGLKSTGVTLSKEQMARLTIAHDSHLNAVPNWTFQALSGAGALRSTANDLLTLLSAAMGYSKWPLTTAMNTMLTTRTPTTTTDLENALGWQVFSFNGKEIVEKDGAALTGGYSSFIGYDTKNRVGVVVLSNASTSAGVSDIGLHVLDARFPLRGRNQRHVAVDAKLFDGYVGRYQLAPDAFLTITRDGNHFLAQMSGQPKVEIFAQSHRNYFYKAFDAQIVFEPDADGNAKAAVLYYNGKISRARRLDGIVQ